MWRLSHSNFLFWTLISIGLTVRDVQISLHISPFTLPGLVKGPAILAGIRRFARNYLNCGQTLKIKILITCVGIKPTEINQWVGWISIFFFPLLDCIQVLVVWGVGKRAWSVVLCGQDEYPVVHDGVSLSSADHEGYELCEN